MKLYYCYILKSLRSNRIYIGSTQDVTNRLQLHNQGKVKSTKAYRPWQLLEYHSYGSRAEAMQAEKHFKTGQQREKIHKKYDLKR